jgi:hypothetical protein
MDPDHPRRPFTCVSCTDYSIITCRICHREPVFDHGDVCDDPDYQMMWQEENADW